VVHALAEHLPAPPEREDGRVELLAELRTGQRLADQPGTGGDDDLDEVLALVGGLQFRLVHLDFGEQVEPLGVADLDQRVPVGPDGEHVAGADRLLPERFEEDVLAADELDDVHVEVELGHGLLDGSADDRRVLPDDDLREVLADLELLGEVLVGLDPGRGEPPPDGHEVGRADDGQHQPELGELEHRERV
jgi:hypothetical protein